jgi:hypothetical protein
VRKSNYAVLRARRWSEVFRLVQKRAMRDWDKPEDDEAFRDL